MRLTKSDPTGNYAYFTDGLSPASAVLSDNFSTFTPGISEYNSLGSRFYLADASGNSRGLLSGSNVNTDGYNWDAFGTLISRNGSNPTMFAWNEASGYQTDNDDGLTLLGHRYYDKRTGRFISQDPAGDGDNWYKYAGNNPMNKVDPTGLDAVFSFPEGSSPSSAPGYLGINANAEVERTQDFLDGVVQGEEQDHMFAQSQAFAMMDMGLKMLGAVAPQMDDATVSVSYGISVGLLFGRVSGGVGVAYDITTRKFEFFRIGGISSGFDVGASLGLGFTVGNDSLGNFGGFNGLTNNLDLLGSSHGLIGLEWNPSYKGIEFSPPGVGPFEYTNFGFEYGLSYGTSNTIPIGKPFTIKLPSLPTVTTLHF